jgi:hypothetical protein
MTTSNCDVDIASQRMISDLSHSDSVAHETLVKLVDKVATFLRDPESFDLQSGIQSLSESCHIDLNTLKIIARGLIVLLEKGQPHIPPFVVYVPNLRPSSNLLGLGTVASSGISAAALAAIRPGRESSELKTTPTLALSNRLKDVDVTPGVTAGSRDSHCAPSAFIQMKIVTSCIPHSSCGISNNLHAVELTIEQLDTFILRLECCKKSLESASLPT